MELNKLKKYNRSWQENLVFISDVLIIIFCYVGAYFLRFDGVPQKKYLHMMMKMLPVVIIIIISVLFYFNNAKMIRAAISIKIVDSILILAYNQRISAIMTHCSLGAYKRINLLEIKKLIALLRYPEKRHDFCNKGKLNYFNISS